MKRVLRGFLGLTLCLGLANAAALAVPARASQAPARTAPYTVGEFAVDLVAAMGQQGQSADAAVATLRGRGVRIGNPSAPLSEGDLVNVLTQVGISVTTTQPDKNVDKSRGREVIGAFSAQLSGGKISTGCVGCTDGSGANPNDDFNNGNGRGGKYKRKKKNSQNGSD